MTIQESKQTKYYREANKMSKIPNRDLSGHCDEGECRNLVREGEVRRQHKIRNEPYSGGSTPSIRTARSRNEQPGFYGGHV